MAGRDKSEVSDVTKDELQQMWNAAKVPYLGEFSGEYKIKLYPRWKWWWLVGVKYINVAGDPQGYNVAWGFVYWGKFSLWRFKGTEPSVLFQYKHIRDYVRDGIGKFCWRGKQRAWFTMEKLEVKLRI